MEFKFDANQDYQRQAIEAVLELLDGQPRVEADIFSPLATHIPAVSNRLDLDDETLLRNLQAVQTQQDIHLSDQLACIEQVIETADGMKTARFPNFSVEMETGTGKTYVYIRTSLELFQRYGLRKFIIVVPSVAVREGVLKTLQVTGKHLHEVYGNIPYRFYVYDSANLSQVRQFALSDSIEIMVMTLDSFNKAANVIHQSTDRLQGETPIHLVQVARPILILDEPQNMESEKSVAALAALDPLFALRYSATHRNPYNVVYRLTPYDAYRQGLVKRIEVAGMVEDNDPGQAFLRLDEIVAQRNTVAARVAVHKLMKDGTIKEKVIKVKQDDSLEEKTERSEYAGYIVDEISPKGHFVRFANNVEVQEGSAIGADKDAVFEAQIRYTIEEHFRKQARFKGDGIKVLSLFFIDRVGNYTEEDGLIRRLFTHAFNDIKSKFPDWKDTDPEDIQAAYFAQRRVKGGTTETIDSVSGKSKEDEDAYDLIMQDKERLLSLGEPVAFIFSHSALREGWDNPNIFQICTLNQTTSEIKKRQEIGRGVRLAVNQNGERLRDERVNILTVVANGSYERYVTQLQEETEAEYGKEGLSPRPANARRRAVAKLRKAYTLRDDFKELWEHIKHRTRYAVTIDSEALIAEVVPEIDRVSVRPLRVSVSKAEVIVEETDTYGLRRLTSEKMAAPLASQAPQPNIAKLIAHLMEHTTPPMHISQQTLLKIVQRIENKQAILDNPYEFAVAAVRIIKDKLADHIVHGIQYEKINEWFEMTQLEEEIESFQEYLVPANNSVYDHVLCDSDIERTFVEGLEKHAEVKLYLKLPGWFKVSTPVGEYNPDWAIIMEDRDVHAEATGKPTLYLVRETKGANWRTSLRPDERRKIRCGEQHFTGGLCVNYRVVADVSELP